MKWKLEWKSFALIVTVFLGFYYLPIDMPRFSGAVMESLALAKWYAREHVILCLIPAFFHRRGHRGVREPGVSDEVSWRKSEQGACLWRGVGIRLHPGGLLMHSAAALRWYLPYGAPDWDRPPHSSIPARRSMCWRSYSPPEYSESKWALPVRSARSSSASSSDF